MTYVSVPEYAKVAARRGLRLRKLASSSRKFGITREQANKLGIDSGIERAKQLIREKRITESKAKRIARFYSRFKNCFTPKCEGAHLIWGGRKWEKVLYDKFYGKENK